ncbi:hypothetical protein [Deinococcus gobiensis]|uniref:Uncharacterized protein n=1 Tax=Deinococcus gobiensis (strain DSM 21396 / JCM 16679 / CGMCC 1.7299 / I-0) TaxID=745776 RepID=H8GXA9_DEIGI|nr:hypothetical protein [Deinococcus gobiensis]AFD25838.1 hypothetical protein DGo_CA1911 [Deinococcus gobiensis I-0]
MYKFTPDELAEYVGDYIRFSKNRVLKGGSAAVLEIDDYISKKRLVVKNDELESIYKSLEDIYSINGLQMHNKRYLEIPVALYSDFAKQISDSIHVGTGITYKIGPPSREYMLFLLSTAKEIPDEVLKYTLHWGHIAIPESSSTEDGDLLTVFSMTSSIVTIKLSSNRDVKQSLFTRYANSYSYEISYLTGRRCELLLNVDRIFETEKIQLHREGEPEIISAPKRMYNKELTDSYQHYLENSLVSSKYLSLYHILEHFFNKASIKETVERVRGVITKTGFSPTKEDHIRQLIAEAASNIEVNQDSRLTSKRESKALSLVISQYLSTPNQLQTLLTREEILYYSSNPVPFCDGITLDFTKNPQDFFEDCAQRIYATRNSIVHSKSENTKRYNFAKDKNALMREIPLIRTLAEIIIEEESEVIA